MMCMAGTESVGNKYISDFVEVEETFLINRIQIKLKKKNPSELPLREEFRQLAQKMLLYVHDGGRREEKNKLSPTR